LALLLFRNLRHYIYHCKGRNAGYIDAYGFILLRVSGAMLLFWISWLFMPKKKLPLDFPRIIAAAFFGVLTFTF
jgi:hypothetical protein